MSEIRTASDYVDAVVRMLEKTIKDPDVPSWYPNFYMSREYVQTARLEAVRIGNLVGVVDPTFPDEWHFPPIAGHGDRLTLRDVRHPHYMIGFPGMVWGLGVWDRQYIYNPQDFKQLKGHEWSSFRRNIRKWPKRHGQNRVYRPMEDGDSGAAADLAQAWAEGKTIQDVDVFLTYILQGENRWGLFRGDKLVGLNAWDENSVFINYRICIDNGEPFLQEYLRYLFYTNNTKDSVVHGKLVNDGGDLDDDGLAVFKEKMNPTAVLTVPTNPIIERQSNEN